MAKHGQYAFAQALRSHITDRDQILTLFQPYVPAIQKAFDQISEVKVNDLSQVIVSTVVGEINRLQRYPPEFQKLTRSCALTHDTNSRVIQTIYRRMDDLISLLLKQESPNQTKFHCLTFTKEGKLDHIIQKYERISWGLRIKVHPDHYQITFPVTDPLTDHKYTWIPCMLQFSKNKGHLMLLIKEKNNYYLFDPNANLNYLFEIGEESCPPSKLWTILKTTVEHIGGKLIRLKHRGFNHTPQLGWYDFDQGQCGTWCLMVAHLTILKKQTIQETLQQLEKISVFHRAITVYSYSTSLASIFQGTRY